MKILIVVGGYGTRFWPASRRSNPKQHQRVVSKNRSLVQLKFDYLSLGFKARDIFVITGKQFARKIKKQLPHIPKKNIILEPAMKDTAPAVGLGLIKIKKLFPNEVVSIQWSDHFIKKPKVFVKALKRGEKLAKETKKDIIIGIPPRFSTPHLGYIKIGKRLRALNKKSEIFLCEFKKFVEKPSLDIAREYIASGNYLWNPGYFIVHSESVLEKYKKFAPSIFNRLKKIEKALGTKRENATLEQAYQSLDKRSFDYVYAEALTANDALVLGTEMGWCDVGEWGSLKEALETSPEANVVKGLISQLNCENCLIYNYEKKKLLSTIDLKGMVVVNTPDAILVCPKDSVFKIKKLLKSFEKTKLEKYI